MSNFFVAVFYFFKCRRILLWVLLSGIVGLLALSALRISFVEDIASFMPDNAGSRRIKDAYQQIGAANAIAVTISPNSNNANQDMLTAAAMRFAEVLQAKDSAQHIKELMCEIDNEKISQVAGFITANMPLYLEAQDYAYIDTIIQPQNILAQLQTDRELLMSPMGGFVSHAILSDPLHFCTNALQKLNNFKQNDNYNTDNGFIFNRKGECIVSITSKYPVSETANNKLLAQLIYSAAQETMNEFAGDVKIIPFGAAMLSITNADQIKKDSTMAVSIALILILALLFYFFGSPLPLLYIALSVGFGALFSLGIMALWGSSISIIALGIASIIFGIAINYPLHFLAHDIHSPSKQKTLQDILSPLLIGNITTMGAFLSLLLISSPAMRDMGLFSSLLLMGTILFTLIFLPHIRVFSNKYRVSSIKYQVSSTEKGVPLKRKGMVFTWLSNFSPEKNKYLVLLFMAATLTLFVFSFGTKFETNLHSINYMTPEQREQISRLMTENHTDSPVQYIITEGSTTEEALQRHEAMLQKTNGTKIAGIGMFFPSKAMQQQKIEQWNAFWQHRRSSFAAALKETAHKEGYSKHAFDGFIAALNKDFAPQEFNYFAPLYKGMGENYISIQADKTSIYSIAGGALPQLDDAHTYTFDDSSIVVKMVDALSTDFSNVLYMCGIIVFLFLLFSFGRLELALLTFIPLTIGWVWILGLMNILDLKFNIVNIILATFIFGQGDDYTIFITEGMIHEYACRRRMLASFKKSILLSAAILFIAIGMLIFAKHPAMRSLAQLTMVGMLSVVLCAYLLPPLLFRFLTQKHGKPRIAPWTLKRFAMTAYAFAAFLLGSLVAHAYGIILFAGRTNKPPKNLLRYHGLLHAFANFVIRRVPCTTFHLENLSGETFQKPALIISNHQSHLDIMCLMMLTPKLIILTNDWVWRSPFYGRIVRWAQFASAAQGMERIMPQLAQAVQMGYSIAVFPEGTRSADCSIGRFHRGALWAAQQLNLDILPIILHGIGHVQAKDDFLLKEGRMTLQIHSRIAPPHTSACLQAAKEMRQWYIQQFAALRRRIETPAYFKHLIRYNYMYKGKHIFAAAMREYEVFSKEYRVSSNEYNENDGTQSNTIAVQDNGYGVKGLLLALCSPNKQIIAADPDPYKTDIAKNCAANPSNLSIK
jgi:1-acyl-sn-glycerol-3-phosphate acyltransferase